jgi:hypothetical protein
MDSPTIVVYGISNQRKNKEVMDYFKRYGTIVNMVVKYDQFDQFGY